jgi:glycyl-tRNA synthetase
MTRLDDADAIGRRYRHRDEIGTPYCVTVDFETLEDRRVRRRERDAEARVGASVWPNEHLAARVGC